jgi:hypothetical protein
MAPVDGIPAPERVFEDGVLKYGTGDTMPRDEYEEHFGKLEAPAPKASTKRRARTRPKTGTQIR